MLLVLLLLLLLLLALHVAHLISSMPMRLARLQSARQNHHPEPFGEGAPAVQVGRLMGYVVGGWVGGWVPGRYW